MLRMDQCALIRWEFRINVKNPGLTPNQYSLNNFSTTLTRCHIQPGWEKVVNYTLLTQISETFQKNKLSSFLKLPPKRSVDELKNITDTISNRLKDSRNSAKFRKNRWAYYVLNLFLLSSKDAKFHDKKYLLNDNLFVMKIKARRFFWITFVIFYFRYFGKPVTIFKIIEI